MSENQVAARLKALRNRTGLSVREVARELGMAESQASTYSTYEGKTFKGEFIPMKWLRRIAPVFVGRGQPPITQEEVLALGMPGTDAAHASLPVSRPAYSEEPAPHGMIVVREYAADAAAGAGQEPVLDWTGQAHIVAEWIIPRDFLPAEYRSGTVAVIKVQGDSMSPTIRSLDRVMVDLGQNFLGADGTYLAWNGMGVVVKRLQGIPGNPPKVRFTSDNPSYEPYTLLVDEVKVFGRVIGKWDWW